AVVTGPTHGTLTGSGSSRTYTPDANYNGTDSCTYKRTDRSHPANSDAPSTSCDAAKSSATKTISITVNPVNDAPLASDSSATLNEDGSTAVNLSALVSDPYPTRRSSDLAVVTGPTHGTLTGSGSSRTYTPDANYNGTDSFTYKVTDRGDPDNCGAPSTRCDAAKSSATQKISLKVNPVNDSPLASDSSATLNEEGTT